ncbi:glycosyltransferase family 4 protein [Sphingomonas sp. 1185]|uniref:glycosyltransferase family 4 protein n=1 Tax=Sphingomonas sp. 1185 TaxID=3156411 RepID=UPI003391E47B
MNDSTTRQCRLAYLTSIPSPYRADMVRAWARHNPHLAISVFYTDPDDQGRGWDADPVGEGVTETRLPVIAAFQKYGKFNRKLAAMVRDHDVIMIGGFEQASYLTAALLAKLYRKPVILLFDGFSPARFGTEPAPILALKRLTVRLAQGLFANGTVGARYLREQLGVARDTPIHNQFLSHREAPIETARQRMASKDKAQIRHALGIPDDGRPVLMTCGYLTTRKRIDLIIDAIARRPHAQRPLLLVVGDGALREILQRQAAEAGVPAYFAGFRLGADLASFYLAADAFVLASNDDPWGLVVNEAMSAGLPVLVSDACGVALDLVKDDVNGFVFRTGDAASLADALTRLETMDCEAMADASRSLVAQWTPAHSAASLGKAVADAVSAMAS